MTKRDHLLGLNALWQDIDADNYKGEDPKDKDLQLKRTKFGKAYGYGGADNFEETNLMQEVVHDIQDKTNVNYATDQDEENDFDFEDYT